jgi:4,5-dihydroxyphthalate decarboxylase
MSKLKLTLACGDYDYLQPLRDGTVRPEGIDLNLLSVACAPRHARMLEHGEYDACEFSMGTYLVARAKGIDRLQAIPFISRRMFCHRFCFVRSDSGIETAADLKGRRIGLLSYQNSLAIFAKAMLKDAYGVSATDVTWVTTAKERIAIKPPGGVKIEPAAAGAGLESLLRSGEIDMLVEPDLPGSWLRDEPSIVRLFPAYETEEREYYKRTRIFPIMHPIVVKKEVLDRDPWVAMSLYDALLRSRLAYHKFMQQPHRLSFAWSRVEDERRFFGKDPFYQGFADNRHDVRSMIDYAYEQGLLSRPLSPEEIFVPNTLDT